MILAPMPFLITVVLAWGLTWPVNKVLLESLSPLWMMALRSAIATRRAVRHRARARPPRPAAAGRRAGAAQHHAAAHGGLRRARRVGAAARADRALGRARLHDAALGGAGGQPVPGRATHARGAWSAWSSACSAWSSSSTRSRSTGPAGRPCSATAPSSLAAAAVGRQHPPHPRPPLAVDAVRPRTLGDAAGHAHRGAAGARDLGRARDRRGTAGSSRCCSTRASRAPRVAYWATAMASRTSARRHDLPRTAGDPRRQRRRGDALARRSR